MKKQLTLFVQSMGGQCAYCGEWPQTLYVSGPKAEAIIDALFVRFGRHTPVRFIQQ